MDLPVDIALLEPPKEYLAFGHLKLITDSSANDKRKKEIKETKITASRKVPRTIRSVSASSKPRFCGQANDAAAGSEIKNKPSLIPRLKSAKELPKREPFKLVENKNTTSRQRPLVEPRNIQRVQLLKVDQDFCPKRPKPPPARPIPTLGRIYRQDPSNDTITDWYLESVSEYLDTPQESVESNVTTNTVLRARSGCNNRISNESLRNEPNSFLNEDDINSTTQQIRQAALNIIYKTTDENVRDWMSSELDHPPKDKDEESGYRSMSPPNRTVNIAKPNNSTVLNVPREKKNYMSQSSVNNSVSTTAIHNESNSDFAFKRKSTNRTLVISNGDMDSIKTHFNTYVPKANTDVKPLTNSKSDIHKPFKYPSTPNPTKPRETFKIPVASYVEYPSEVLQKTTNFETEETVKRVAYMTPSNTGADFESSDKYSSQWTIDHVDEYSLPTDDTAWSREQSSSFITQKKSWKDNNDVKSETSQSKCPDKCCSHDYYKHYCWRKEVAKRNFEDQHPWDHDGRFKKCHKYAKHSSNKKKCND